jgi:hypothetical protein
MMNLTQKNELCACQHVLSMVFLKETQIEGETISTLQS